VGLERGPLSLVSIIEELLARKSSGSGLENRYYGRRGSAALTTRHLPNGKSAVARSVSFAHELRSWSKKIVMILTMKMKFSDRIKDTRSQYLIAQAFSEGCLFFIFREHNADTISRCKIFKSSLTLNFNSC
jgi:hypothetical protein